MSLNTTHKGYNLDYNEENNTWFCSALNYQDVASLRALKEKIDKHHRSDRRVDQPAIVVAHPGRGKQDIVACTITVLVEPSKHSTKEWPQEAWITLPDKQREKQYLSHLTYPEHSDLIKQWFELVAIANKASEAASKHFDAIPRCDAQELIRRAAAKNPAGEPPVSVRARTGSLGERE